MEVEQYNNINVKIYGAYVIPVIVYGSECWCLRKEDERRILVVEMNWLQIILGRFRRDKIWNEATRKELGQEITSIGRQNQEKKACVAQIRKKDGGQETTTRSVVQAGGGSKKQRRVD